MLEKLLPLTAVCAIVLAVVVVAPVPAQQQPAVSIAVVDNTRILEESGPGQSAQQQIQAEYEQWQTRVQQAQQELQDLQAQASTVTGVEAQSLQQQIEEKQVEIQRLRDDANREFGRLREQVLAELQNVLAPAIEALGQEGGYTVILNSQSQGVLYYDSAVDVTDQLISRLEAPGDTGQD